MISSDPEFTVNILTSAETVNRPILLVKSSSCPVRVRSWALERNADWNWIFLCGNYLEMKRWQNCLGDYFSYVPIAHELDTSAKLLKKPYLELMAKLGRNHAEPAWWASRISERNTLVSPLFENICRLDSVRNLVNQLDRPVLIVVDNTSLLKTIKRSNWLGQRKIYHLAFHDYLFSSGLAGAKEFVTGSGFGKLVLLLYRTCQLIFQALQSKVAPSNNLPSDLANLVLIHTYIDETNFSVDGEFRDSYFPGLEAFLKLKGYRVLVLPVMFNLQRSFRSAWCWTKSSTSNFLNPFKLYHFSDYLFALRIAYRTAYLPTGRVNFAGNDLTMMFRAEAIRTAFDSLFQILYLRLPLRLRNKGIKCSALIAEFENMIPERMLILGFRAYQPKAELIGFQHGAVYPHLLCQYSPPEEREIVPTYDRVICNGSLFRDILVVEGLLPEIAVVGAALRYSHLWKQNDFSKLQNERKLIDVFVPLSMVIPASVELLDKLVVAFGSDTSVSVVLKAHPMTTIDAVMSASGLKSLPAHFRTTNDAVSEILPNARVMVGLSTCTMFEAVAAGVPVVRVHRESAIDLDPLSFLGDFSPAVRSAPELFSEVRRQLNLSDFEREELYRAGRKILAAAFHPYDEEGLNSFLPTQNA